MGEAKRRGTFEQRKAQAIVRRQQEREKEKREIAIRKKERKDRLAAVGEVIPKRKTRLYTTLMAATVFSALAYPPPGKGKK